MKATQACTHLNRSSLVKCLVLKHNTFVLLGFELAFIVLLVLLHINGPCSAKVFTCVKHNIYRPFFSKLSELYPPQGKADVYSFKCCLLVMKYGF